MMFFFSLFDLDIEKFCNQYRVNDLGMTPYMKLGRQTGDSLKSAKRLEVCYSQKFFFWPSISRRRSMVCYDQNIFLQP